MKNKKGFLFSIPILIYMVLSIIILALMVWFGLRISEGITALISFFQNYWWVVLIILVLIAFYRQFIAILNFLLGKIGIKV